uniref:ABC transporter domain-containing protein n=1 Tax=Calcidiscus leptoporus TaxID=127549 RepID=A0A7S0NXL9_9EUKA|mmetsp:Transcript_37686/g.88146  ORF Transcript_37686/g.88146 Transcript_37686/m.88146 type:complete len:673 (+) Transcript_37686:60-2078(+)|eukprot:CAMPEP_0119378488 /NCGR_PEP_ID=MMETSP1334-20130426/48504_1 /TAXON_ID=127549 /ORGANISM="Calcidiscus leptoporus, Strain RCC1130" /LENGTH=672 /DNA_ID=CAMNT_0007397707 /DNA_START=243 /DNA_END=2261 /DNA_ORIENTATION=+
MAADASPKAAEARGPSRRFSAHFKTSVHPVGLEWRQLALSITKPAACRSKPAATKKILNGCDGRLPGGRLLAVMGPSGSGKTSFLNALADRTPRAKGLSLSGTILVDGVPREQVPFSRLSSYVLQDDAMYPMLTVYETMLLSARLRLPSRTPLKEKVKRVEALIDELGLQACSDVIIGDERHKGVSGGERKRTAVGVEIIGDPDLIFLDEPTSGLDAFQALNTIKMLTRLTKNRGRTVVLSIHQPRSSIYAMFDRLLLLAGGNVMYNGDGSAAVSYFEAAGHPCPIHYNPADFFIDLVSVDVQLDGEADRARIRLLAAAAEQSLINSIDVEHGHASAAETVGTRGPWALCATGYASSPIEQFRLLYLRSVHSRSRDKPALLIPLVTSIFFALVVSALYSEMNLTQKSIQDRTGVLFFICINQALGGVFATVNTFPKEKKIVGRERNAQAYAVLPYYAAKWLAEFPFVAMGPILFSCILYWLIGLVPEADNFFIFMGIVVTTNACAVSLGMFISSFASTVEQAGALAPLVVIVFLLFGGFYANTDNIPDAISWITEISLFKWAFKALAINEYSDLIFVNEEGTSCLEVPPANVSSTAPSCNFVNGEQVLELLTFDSGSIAQCVLYLAIIALVCHLGAYSCLVAKAQKFAPLEAPTKRESAAHCTSSRVETAQS